MKCDNLIVFFQMRCIARNVVAICSLKQRDASQPNFVALVPHLEKGESDGMPVPKGFLVSKYKSHCLYAYMQQ